MENLSNTFASFLNRLQQAFFFFDTAYLLTGAVFQVGMYYLLPTEILKFLSRPSHLFIEPWIFKLLTTYILGLFILQIGRLVFKIANNKKQDRKCGCKCCTDNPKILNVENVGTEENWFKFNQATINGDYKTHTDRYWLIQNYFNGLLGCSILWGITSTISIFLNFSEQSKLKDLSSVQNFYDSKFDIGLSGASILHFLILLFCVILSRVSFIQTRQFKELTNQMLLGFINIENQKVGIKTESPK